MTFIYYQLAFHSEHEEWMHNLVNQYLEFQVRSEYEPCKKQLCVYSLIKSIFHAIKRIYIKTYAISHFQPPFLFRIKVSARSLTLTDTD